MPYTIGCDVMHIHRIRHPEQIAQRLLSQPEYEKYLSLHGHRQLEYLAGRFAAREAIVKAVGHIVDYKQIVIDPPKPVLYEGYTISISISHDEDVVMAVALAYKEETV